MHAVTYAQSLVLGVTYVRSHLCLEKSVHRATYARSHLFLESPILSHLCSESARLESPMFAVTYA